MVVTMVTYMIALWFCIGMMICLCTARDIDTYQCHDCIYMRQISTVECTMLTDENMKTTFRNIQQILLSVYREFYHLSKAQQTAQCSLMRTYLSSQLKGHELPDWFFVIPKCVCWSISCHVIISRAGKPRCNGDILLFGRLAGKDVCDWGNGVYHHKSGTTLRNLLDLDHVKSIAYTEGESKLHSVERFHVAENRALGQEGANSSHYVYRSEVKGDGTYDEKNSQGT